MKIILTFDMERGPENSNNHQGIRSAFERFGWHNMGGSVFVYDGEDWLNGVVPGLMFFRSFVARRKLTLKKLTLTADITSIIARDDGASAVQAGGDLHFEPSNTETNITERVLRDWVDACATAILIIPRFRGHPNRREDARGVFDGEEAGTKEATGVHAGIQGGGRASLQGGRPQREAGREGPRPDGDRSA
jgi:hypothetical protein